MIEIRIRPILLGSLSLCVAMANAVFASDGVIEINQICASLTGCVPGDVPGFPVTLMEAGSYRLTSNLDLPDADTSAISIESGDVSLDLGGFAIRGITICSGSPPAQPLVCAPLGSGRGITIGENPDFVRSVVRNGSIDGMGDKGLVVLSGSVVTELRVANNGATGIDVNGAGALVRDNTVERNGGHGISVSSGSVISGNAASRNGIHGISTDDTCIVERNSATFNAGYGIRALTGSHVRGNVAAGNGVYGLMLGSQTAYSANSIDFNGVAPVSGGRERGGNSCFGTGTVSEFCP